MNEAPLTCSMERFGTGLICGKPAIAIWYPTYGDIKEMPVCKLCSLTVWVNEGRLEEIKDQHEDRSNQVS